MEGERVGGMDGGRVGWMESGCERWGRGSAEDHAGSESWTVSAGNHQEYTNTYTSFSLLSITPP